jgi:hypothetical protein
MASKKLKTNDDMLKALLKDLHMLETALLRERIVKISEITRQAIKKNPKDFDNFMVDHTWFIALCDKIDKHLGFENDKPKQDGK